MKKIVVLLLIMILCMGIVTVSAAEESKLSEMSDEQCISFVLENGISIPQWYETDIEWAPFIRHIIQKTEEDSNVIFTFGHTDLLIFSEEIRAVVLEYYGPALTERTVTKSTTNILEDNWVSGS